MILKIYFSNNTVTVDQLCFTIIDHKLNISAHKFHKSIQRF